MFCLKTRQLISKGGNESC